MKKAGYKVTRQELQFNAFSELGGSALEQTEPDDVTYDEGTATSRPRRSPSRGTSPPR